MHRTIMDSFVILILIGAGLHLTSSAEIADDSSAGRYTKPVVYTNLSPPVLYFPNFPEKQKISERGDKRVEYMPFPFKDLPLLVYQSNNQPSVHVVQQQQTVGGSGAGANQLSPAKPPGNDGKSNQQSGPAVYTQSNGQQYHNIQMVPVQQGNGNPSTYSAAQDTFPDLQNHQFISIGLSTIQDYLGNRVFPAAQPPTSQSQQVPNGQSYTMQSTNQYPQQQGHNVANQVPPPQTQQYFVRQNGGQQNSQAPMQYSAVQSGQQSATSYQNSNTKVLPQPQQNMISKYAQSTPMQHQQNTMKSIGSQIQQEQGYSNQNLAQIQFVQNNQQQNVAYRQQNQNGPQSPYNAMQQVFYQQAGDTNPNVNSLQHLGIAITTVQPPSLSNQPQIVSNKVMGQNAYQQNRQNQQPQPQMEPSSDENDSDEIDPQYIRIAVYPYGAIDPNQMEEPDQFYKIAIPQANEEEEDEENENSMEVNNGKTQQVANQVQGSRYRGSSSSVGQNLKQQRPFYANSNQQRLPNKMNGGNIHNQQRNKGQIQKQAQQNSPENQISEEQKYQQILIHIPHSIAAAPQILVQPDDDRDQSSASYMSNSQSQQRRKPSSTNKQRKPQSQFTSSNNGFQVADYLHPATGSISFNQRYVRPKPMPRFPPVNYASAASSNYPRKLFRFPFGNKGGRYANKPILPMGSAHPEIYSSSNLHFTSVNPLFMPNPMRNMHRDPFNQMSASLMRPQFLPSPLMPMNSMFHSSFADELMAQASFPRITRSRKDDLNNTSEKISDNGFLNTDSSSENERIMKSLAAKSTEAFLRQIASDVQTHDMLDGVLGTSKNPGVAAFNVPQLPDFLNSNYDGQVPSVPFFPIPHQSVPTSQSQGGGKYGNFMKKLASLSNSLIYQSMGMKPPTPFREGTKVKHHSSEYSIEDIIDSVLPENASPRSTIMKADRIGAFLPEMEFSKRVLNTEDTNANPPIIVYKGLKSPVEVYGNKDDIEVSKDPLETSASEERATSRVADDIDETNPEKVFDYVDMMYSLLPDFIKHSIGDLNDDQLGGERLLVDSTSAPKIKPKEDISSDEPKTTTDVKSTNSGKEASSAFKEDIEELSKFLHKEEKSDLMPF